MYSKIYLHFVERSFYFIFISLPKAKTWQCEMKNITAFWENFIHIHSHNTYRPPFSLRSVYVCGVLYVLCLHVEDR